MAHVVATHNPSSQPCGVGARLLRRLGGTVCNAVAGGLSLAGVLRRPAAPQSGLGHPVGRNTAACPVPGKPPRPRRPYTAPLAPPAQQSRPARPGWLARILGRSPARPVPASQTPFLDDPDAPFTPETYPGLSQEFCAILNTPLEELDPEILRRLVAAFAATVARAMPPNAAMPDAASLFSTVWDRLAGVLDAATPDAPPTDAPPTDAPSADAPPADAPPADAPPADAPPPDAPPADALPAPAEALPRAPRIAPDPPPAASSPAPSQPLPDAPLAPLTPLPGARAPHQAHRPLVVAATQHAPGTVSPGPVPPFRRLVPRRRPFRNIIGTTPPAPRRRLRGGPAFFRRLPQQRLLQRCWCYAARASPA